MRQNYLYKCTDCQTVKAIEDNLGQSTWALSCRSCGYVTTEHYRLDVIITSEILKSFYICSVVCPKEKEDNDKDKEEQVDVNRPVD